MRPVVESLVGELSTLGVVGLLLGVLNVHGEESWLTQLSIRYYATLLPPRFVSLSAYYRPKLRGPHEL